MGWKERCKWSRGIRWRSVLAFPDHDGDSRCFRSMTDKTLVNPGAQSLAADVEDRRALRNHGTCRIGTDIRRRERRLAGLISRKGKGGLDRAMCAGDNAVLDHEPPYIVIGQKKPSRELPWTRQQLQLEAQ